MTPRTRSFRDLVQGRVANDPAFSAALLRESIDTMLAGDVDTGRAILRDYIKATVGFEELGAATGIQPKSLIRMFGPRGNPQARNLFSVIGYLRGRYATLKISLAPRAGTPWTVSGTGFPTDLIAAKESPPKGDPATGDQIYKLAAKLKPVLAAKLKPVTVHQAGKEASKAKPATRNRSKRDPKGRDQSRRHRGAS
jgi:DNA-binding phage protein